MPKAARHACDVVVLMRRVAAFLVVLSVSTAGVADCAGWGLTPDARMACCEDGACPMHGRTASATEGRRVVTQREADSCCAVSESHDSWPASAIVSLSAALVATPVATLVPLTRSAVSRDAWRTHVPLQRTHVPTYVLLSVFLI